MIQPDYEKLIDMTFEINNRCKKVNDHLWNLFQELSPSNYAPFIENDEMSWFLTALKYTVPELYEELCSILYDGLIYPQTLKYGWKEFQITKPEDTKEYLIYRFIKNP